MDRGVPSIQMLKETIYQSNCNACETVDANASQTEAESVIPAEVQTDEIKSNVTEIWVWVQLGCFSTRLSSDVASCYLGPAPNLGAWKKGKR